MCTRYSAPARGRRAGHGLPIIQVRGSHGGGDMLDRVESWLECLFELPARRLFRTRLQPVELARAVVHAMEQQRLIGPKGELVPNHYLVALHPADYDQLATWRISLEGELAAHAEQRARERGWRWSGRVVVEIV